MTLTRSANSSSSWSAARAALVVSLALPVLAANALQAQSDPMSSMGGMMMMDHGEGVAASGMMIIPMMKNPMLPGMIGARPKITPFLPGKGMDLASIAEAKPREILSLKNGDTLDLKALIVKRKLHDKTYVMYGFNGQYPGPMIRVTQNATIQVRFTNNIDLPTTVHWHGIRLENKFDGVPDLTQAAVKPGETFWYTVKFPDAGIYWYHPHVQEQIQQDLGLYGNLLIDSPAAGYYNPVNDEEFLMLDDILMDGDSLVPFGKEAADFAIMGRFGNHMLVNGETHYHREATAGDVVRFFVTNVSNTRTFNLSFGGAPMKLVGADAGKFEKETMVSSLVIAPSQRYIVEVMFNKPGEFVVTNSVRPLDHMMGEFYFAVDTLGMVMVNPGTPKTNNAQAFQALRQDPAVKADIDKYRAAFDRPVDHEIRLTVEMKDLPIIMMHFISIDTTYRSPVEWTDTMADMNWIATSKEVRWILRDEATKKENMDIDWQIKQGEPVKIRIFNDPKSFHPMNHPIHLHGQRFLTVARNGVPVDNLAWKDTELIPVGGTVDLILDTTNPGKWMIHCHIAEHLDAGMMGLFTINP